MPIKPLRRLGAPAADSLHDSMSESFLRSVGWRHEMDAIERGHPELILRDGGNALAAGAAPNSARAQLYYAFENERAFIDRFPELLDALLPKIRRSLRVDSVRFRLSYSPARATIEPVLKKLWFRPARDWLSFSLDRSAKLSAAPAPSGVKFREGAPADFDELVRLDEEAFPDTPLSATGMHAITAENGPPLIAMAGRQIAGFCLSWLPEPDQGWISIVAVAEDHRGRGIGAALTTRAAKRIFAAGAQRVGLTTDEANFPAMRLYVRLGFKQTTAGRDYVRPVDPKAIEKIKADAQGTFIKFGGWR